MFERYTEKARRVIFFARYEASSFGSPSIESEHLLLGLLRENESLLRPFAFALSAESIRSKILAKRPPRATTATSVDLPLSDECKRALAYAAEEAERLAQRHIGTEHLLLGLLREERSLASEILRDAGMRVDAARVQLSAAMQAQRTSPDAQPFARKVETSLNLTPSGMRVLLQAQTYADRVMPQQITVEHLLLGMLSDESSSATEILRACGLRTEDALERLERSNRPL